MGWHYLESIGGTSLVNCLFMLPPRHTPSPPWKIPLASLIVHSLDYVR